MRASRSTAAVRLALALLVRSVCTVVWSASSEDLNRVPMRSPMTSADPFNPAAAASWTNGQQPPAKDRFGRFVYLPSKDTVPYASFFTISGRACGYLYVDAEDRLPRAGSRIRLSVDTSISLSVLQVNTKGRPAGGKGGRIYAYLCADGQYHRMGGGAGRWTYDVWRQAETGVPLYADTGVVAPPHFIELPAAGSVLETQTDPCADRQDWRSLDHHLTCKNYRGLEKDHNWCSDMGYIDPSLIDPRNSTGTVEWNVPAYLACPTACRICMTCELNMTIIDRDDNLVARLAALRRKNIVIDGCAVGYNCVDLKGAPLMEAGQLIPTPFDLLKRKEPDATRDYVPIPSFFSSELASYLKELKYTCKSRRDQPLLEVERNVVEVEAGSVFETVFSMRVFSATPHSLVRYTLDGTDPRYDHGHLMHSGGVIELRHSAQVKGALSLCKRARARLSLSLCLSLSLTHSLSLSRARSLSLSLSHTWQPWPIWTQPTICQSDTAASSPCPTYAYASRRRSCRYLVWATIGEHGGRCRPSARWTAAGCRRRWTRSLKWCGATLVPGMGLGFRV